MKLIPVLDLMGQYVVRGIAGKREEYQPNTSCLLNNSDPVETAVAFKDHFEVDAIYIADLDALEGSEHFNKSLQALSATGLELIVDAGVATPQSATELCDHGATQVVVPLETLPNLDVISQVIDDIGASQTVFSLDLKNGQPLGEAATGRSPLEVAQEAISLGIQKMIVLDLAGVGTSQGVLTTDLCKRIQESAPHVELISGGGVRSLVDLAPLKQCNISGVLIASALHDGRITPEQWKQYRKTEDSDHNLF